MMELRRVTRQLLVKGQLPPVTWLMMALTFSCLVGFCFGMLIGGAFNRSNSDRSQGFLQGDNLETRTNGTVVDFRRYPEDHWRMLLPGHSAGSLETFVQTVASALRSRPLGKVCLVHAMDEFASVVTRDTMWLEFGVWKGSSLNFIGRKSRGLGRKGKVYGFDSFKGLPETWRTSEGVLGDAWAAKWTKQGAFDLKGEPPEFLVDRQDNVDFVVGYFNESLPKFLEKEKGEVSLVHIDSDLYSSAKLALELVSPRLQRGTILVFDELINYPGFRDGEIKALYEWINSAAFRRAGLTGVQVVGYRGPNLLLDDEKLKHVIREQRGEGRKYPQDAIFRVW